MNHPRRAVRISPLGNMGNRMIQHLVAVALISGIEGARIEGVGLPEWGITHDESSGGQPDLVLEGQQFDIDSARTILTRREGGLVEINGYGQQMRHLPPLPLAKSLFPAPRTLDEIRGFDEDVILINIRGEEIFHAVHHHYTLLPVQFYRETVERSGLRPVFLGQIGTGEYFRHLRAALPQAEFIPSRGAMLDFTVLRRSRYIMIGVSTFSWLAAWLSEAERIHLPVCGLFNPMQLHLVDLLPLTDPRYIFHLFPITYAALPETLEATHAALTGLWREVTPEFLDICRRGAPRVARSREDHLAIFSEPEYLAMYPLFAAAVRGGRFPDGLTHYKTIGYDERRHPRAFNAAWYARTYPLAALEVSEGDYAGLFHHWLVIGHKRGYLPVPPADQNI